MAVHDVGGRVDRQQLDLINYLKEENEVVVRNYSIKSGWGSWLDLDAR